MLAYGMKLKEEIFYGKLSEKSISGFRLADVLINEIFNASFQLFIFYFSFFNAQYFVFV